MLLRSNKFLGEWRETTAQMPGQKRTQGQNGKAKKAAAVPRYLPEENNQQRRQHQAHFACRTGNSLVAQMRWQHELRLND